MEYSSFEALSSITFSSKIQENILEEIELLEYNSLNKELKIGKSVISNKLKDFL